jgi:hypothetical protein
VAPVQCSRGHISTDEGPSPPVGTVGAVVAYRDPCVIRVIIDIGICTASSCDQLQGWVVGVASQQLRCRVFWHSQRAGRETLGSVAVVGGVRNQGRR